ncbi:Eukaryotic translation initiation factor 4E type 3 [Trichoplax sp. H2]|nr:Eukaryotic translation initiation factor 4E type 3 [Trichoplax sp. H2]|eukprot:RDD36410.1 Eukaryotic translation initiation factor 4E type 3 [Trichoplax sp. H2]
MDQREIDRPVQVDTGEESKQSSDVSWQINLADEDDDNVEKIPAVPLGSRWTFWCDTTYHGLSKDQYEDNLKKIMAVDTIQGFWSVYDHIPKVSSIKLRSSYFLMRNETRPIWEDPVNRNGGSYKTRCIKENTEDVWRELLLASIGEQFSKDLKPLASYLNASTTILLHFISPLDDDICGVSISIREKSDVVQIWHANANNKENFITYIERKLKQLLPTITLEQAYYKSHQDHQAFEGVNARQTAKMNRP